MIDILKAIELFSTFANDQLTYWTIIFSVVFIFLWHRWQYTPFKTTIESNVGALKLSLSDINDTLVKRSISKPVIWNGDYDKLMSGMYALVDQQSNFLKKVITEAIGDNKKVESAVKRFYLFLIDSKDIAYVGLQKQGISSALFHIIKYCDRKLSEYIEPKIEYISLASSTGIDPKLLSSEIDKFAILCKQYWKDCFDSETRHCELI